MVLDILVGILGLFLWMFMDISVGILRLFLWIFCGYFCWDFGAVSVDISWIFQSRLWGCFCGYFRAVSRYFIWDFGGVRDVFRGADVFWGADAFGVPPQELKLPCARVVESSCVLDVLIKLLEVVQPCLQAAKEHKEVQTPK